MNTVIEVIAPRLLGPALMVAAGLIVKGYSDVGDGFSAAVVVGLAVALRYIALGVEAAEASLPILRHAPVGAVAGMLGALACGFFPIALGDPPFTHLPRAGEPVTTVGTLELITAVAFDLALFLLVASVLVVLIHQLAMLVRSADG
jgi:multisubunit Na+/H+ antiporter MnhB subunit